MKLRTTIVIEHGPDGRTDQNVTGNVVKVFNGDAVQQALLLGDLHRTFAMKFERGDLSVESLELVLWQSHWHLASRKAMQRAADMLILAAANEIKIPGSSKLARECEGLAKVLDLFVNAKPADHPIGDALLRGEPIPNSNVGILDQLYASALRADGIRPTALLTSEESQALAEQIRSTADAVEAVGAELAESEAKAPEGAGSTVVADDSPFRLYGFAHEMLEVLQRINIKVAGRDAVYSHGLQPSEQMLAEADSAMEAVWVLLDKIAGRGPMEMDPDSVAAIEGMIRQAAHQEATDQLKELVAPAPTATSIIEQRVRERAERRYQREVMDTFFAFRQFCGSFEPVIDGKPHKAVELLQELERQCYEQGKQRAGDNAVEDVAATIAYRLEGILGGAA